MGSGICKEQERERRLRKKRGEEQQSNIREGKWMPGEMLRRRIGKAKTTAENGEWERESELSKARERRQNLNYSADSHNTRTWPSQLTANSGEISFFYLSPQGTFTALRDKPAY